jgi:hypothetical protein
MAMGFYHLDDQNIDVSQLKKIKINIKALTVI